MTDQTKQTLMRGLSALRWNELGFAERRAAEQTAPVEVDGSMLEQIEAAEKELEAA